MENCLVTKLKGIVDNDNLYKLGEMRFVYNKKNSGDPGFMCKASPGKTVTMTILDGPTDAVFTNNNNTSIEVGTNNVDFNVSAVGEYVISISDKYNLALLTKNGINTSSVISYIILNEDIAYSSLDNIIGCLKGDVNCIPTGITTMTLKNNKLEEEDKGITVGDFNLGNYPSLTGVSLIILPNVDINIDTIPNNSNLTRIVIEACGNISGSLSSLLKAQGLTSISLDRTNVSGNINVFINNGALALPALTSLSITRSPNIVASDADITTLRGLGVTVVIS